MLGRSVDWFHRSEFQLGAERCDRHLPALANSMHSVSSESALSRIAGDENTKTNFSFLKTVTCNARSACRVVSHWYPDIMANPTFVFYFCHFEMLPSQRRVK